MPVPLVTQHYPDDFQVVTYAFDTTLVDPWPLLYADRSIVIDSIVVGVTTAAAGGSSGALSFEKTTGPINGSGTVLAVAGVDDNNLDAGHYIVLDGNGSVRRFNGSGELQSTATGSTQLSSSENQLNAGQWLVVDFTGTFANFRGFVQVRFRSRVA
jgi:hypothetical protein